MQSRVDVTFECLPLRDVARLDVPIDASEAYQRFVLCVKDAIDKHGRHNTYYLSRGHCIYHLTNEAGNGEISFHFNGTAFTDENDVRCVGVDIEATFAGESCAWLTQPIVDWFITTVPHTVKAEFDRFIHSGDLEKAQDLATKRIEQANEAGGYLGMYL